MTSTEEAELKRHIASLAGVINRHKYAQDRVAPRTTKPYFRTFPANVSRHRSLVLTKKSSKPSPNNNNAVKQQDMTISSEIPSPCTDAWVQKRERHLQIINRDIFVEKSNARKAAILKTEAEQKNQRELTKQKLALHLGNSTQNQVTVSGVKYIISAGGSKLLRLQGMAAVDTNSKVDNFDSSTKSILTPKRITVAGVEYIRSKGGNLVLASSINRKMKSSLNDKETTLCSFFTRTGSCSRGSACQYMHDAEKTALCPRILKGTCTLGSSCDLSHELTPHRVPMCSFFARGTCTNPECKFSHIYVNPTAPVCRDFATNGYCDQGALCKARHVHECPEFDRAGTCPNAKCKLPHIARARNLRRNVSPPTHIEFQQNEEAIQDASGSNSSLNEKESDNDSESSSDGDDVDSSESDTDSSFRQDFIHL